MRKELRGLCRGVPEDFRTPNEGSRGGMPKVGKIVPRHGFDDGRQLSLLGIQMTGLIERRGGTRVCVTALAHFGFEQPRLSSDLS